MGNGLACTRTNSNMVNGYDLCTADDGANKEKKTRSPDPLINIWGQNEIIYRYTIKR